MHQKSKLQLKVLASVFIFAGVFLNFGISNSQGTVIKNGSPCLKSQLNKKINYLSDTFTCVKLNGKYRFKSTGSAITDPSNTPAQNQTTGLTSGKIVPNVGVVFNPGATQTLEVWEDLQCPYCALFETVSGKDLRSLISAGNTKVIFHVLGFLGPDSLAAANAVYCAVGANKFLDLKTVLHNNVQAGLLMENSGIMGIFLPTYEAQLGLVDQNFQNCVGVNKYLPLVRYLNNQADINNLPGTPAVYLNGTKLDNQTQLFNEAGFKTAVGLSAV